MDLNFINEYNVELKLAMTIKRGWNANNAIFDYGSTADTYSFNGDILTLDYRIWERLASNAPSVVLNGIGFNPFGTQFAGDVTGKRYPTYKKKANVHGDFHRWGGEMIPNNLAGYSYNTAVWVPTGATGFGLFGLSNFPVPICTPNAEYSITYNRIGKIVREYDKREQTEHRQFTMKWEQLCDEDLRAILIQLITVVRGNTFPIDFGDSLERIAPWLPRGGELLTGEYILRLSSPIVSYSFNNGFWNLEIEVMKWES